MLVARRRPVSIDELRRELDSSDAIALQQFFTTALLERKHVRVLYHGREPDLITERVISPQRLVYCRSNRYLNAWCHLRRGWQRRRGSTGEFGLSGQNLTEQCCYSAYDR